MVVIYRGYIEVAVDTLKGAAFVTRRLVYYLRVYHIYTIVTIDSLILWALPGTYKSDRFASVH